MHECAIPWCSRQIAATLLMRRQHWAMVPGDVQRAVYRHWRRIQSGYPDNLGPYERARQAAIDAVHRASGIEPVVITK